MKTPTDLKRIEIEVINLSGELDTATLADFKENVANAFSNGANRVIVDCRELGFISSSGLAALLWARSKAAAKGRKIYFTHVSTVVSEVLELTKLAGLLRIEPTTRGLLLKFGAIRKPTHNKSRKAPLASTFIRR